MLRLYDFHESGNGYKVRLLLTRLGTPFERVELDVLKGETRTPGFLAKNPNHRIPLVEWPDGRRLAESNAILFHLARGTALLADDPWLQAEALQWMFFEQYSHEPYIAVVRFWHLSGTLAEHRAELEEKIERGHHALSVMEGHLRDRDWLVGDRDSIADIALYAYTHVAHEGGYDLAPYPAVRAWIDRVAARPGHLRIDEPAGTPVAWP
jgi:glutathione S-transferase